MTLYADGVAVGEEVTLDAATLTYTWENLPKYKDHGTLIVYTVDETTVPEVYEADVDGNTITNSYSPFFCGIV